MKIQLAPHTLKRACERGATEEEIKDTLLTGKDIPAKNNRLAKTKVYGFSQERNGKYYPEKRVEVFYVIERETIITVTVYVFYGKW